MELWHLFWCNFILNPWTNLFIYICQTKSSNVKFHIVLGLLAYVNFRRHLHVTVVHDEVHAQKKLQSIPNSWQFKGPRTTRARTGHVKILLYRKQNLKKKCIKMIMKLAPIDLTHSKLLSLFCWIRTRLLEMNEKQKFISFEKTPIFEHEKTKIEGIKHISRAIDHIISSYKCIMSIWIWYVNVNVYIYIYMNSNQFSCKRSLLRQSQVHQYIHLVNSKRTRQIPSS